MMIWKKKYAQELLSTFSQSIGEVALQPSKGGTFIVAVTHNHQQQQQQQPLQEHDQHDQQQHQQQQQEQQQQQQSNTNTSPNTITSTNTNTHPHTDNDNDYSPSTPTPTPTPTTTTTTTTILWDRSVDGGFPETKELKRRLRDVVEPGRNLGHVDGHRRSAEEPPKPPKEASACEDCPPSG
ncbi:hypothetical protein CP532_1661 [Ophiocordyceps camponoti-leonardi (nom. inval.)]|nr:hypothetical protein CP532_1661 [Ophiocordyceps camponoti-leonardi (nom. inval.)]